MSEAGKASPDSKDGSGGKFGAVTAGVGMLAGLVAIYQFAELKFADVCDSFDVAWCAEAAREPTQTGVPVEQTTPLANSAIEGVAISIRPQFQPDTHHAAALNRSLGRAIEETGIDAAGYQIEGIVSNSVHSSSRRSYFVLSWSISKGRVFLQCNDISVSYPSGSDMAASVDVAEAIKPVLAESVKFQDVRCI